MKSRALRTVSVANSLARSDRATDHPKTSMSSSTAVNWKAVGTGRGEAAKALAIRGSVAARSAAPCAGPAVLHNYHDPLEGPSITVASFCDASAICCLGSLIKSFPLPGWV